MRPASSRAGRAGWWAILLVAVLAIGGVAGGIYLTRRHHQGGRVGQATQQWTCPMHPQIVRSEPGNCPLCGMALVPMEKPTRQPEKAPQPSEESAVEVPGYGRVEIDPRKQQLLGVRVAPVARRRLSRVIRTVGTVVVDESRLSTVYPKVEGWVEQLLADQTGKLVRKGQPLLTIYSPELLSTQREYLVALRSQRRLASSPFPEVRKSGESLLNAARERLRLWDVSEEELRRLETTGEVRRSIALYAPSTGYVLEKMVVAGMRVMPSMELYRLADLSRVWVEAEIYAQEASLVSVGQPASLTTEAAPGRTYRGRVSYVYPSVQEMTRTLKARLEFSNPDLRLKPGMFVSVQLTAPGEEALAVPETAVLDTGTRRLVFVQTGEGVFQPREVTLGPRGEGHYPVLSGISVGEKVVVSPNFLLDSESQLRSALSSGGSGNHAGH